MNHFFIALSVALFASAQVYGYSAGNNYHQQSAGAEYATGDYHLQGASDSNNAASAAASANSADAASGLANAGPSSYGTNQNIPYQPANTRGNSISSSISYPNNKGEILIHRPAAIIVKRPPTKVVVNHPPLVVKPAPVVLHKPPAVVVRKVFVKHHPRPVKVEPVYVNVVKPPAEKYFVNEKQQEYAAPHHYAPINVNAGGYGASAPSSGASAASASDAGYGSSALSNAAADNAGYQLLQSNQGMAALANLAGSGHGNYGHHSAPTY